MDQNNQTPILIPLQPDVFWNQVRTIIREEVGKIDRNTESDRSLLHTSGMSEKPLFKISEVCKLFTVSRPTIYEWIKDGKLRPFKIRSRVYFLRDDIQQLLGAPLNIASKTG